MISFSKTPFCFEVQLSLYNSNPYGEHKFVRDEETSNYGVKVYKALLIEGTRKLVRVKETFEL